MFHIPQSVIENLKCSVCEGYLSSKPVMIKDNKQVCGKCYRILPEEEKSVCVRQLSYEILGDSMLFPCKFHKMGCTYTFSWNDQYCHEAECSYRYFTCNKPLYNNPDSNKPTVKLQTITCETDSIKANFNYEIKENKYDKEVKNLVYQLNIAGTFGKILSIKDIFDSKNEQNDVILNLEGAVSLRNSPEVIYSDIKVQSLSENNIYATLNSDKTNLFLNCNPSVINNNGLSHLSCGHCRYNSCRACEISLTGSMDSVVACKNYFKGCREKLEQSEAGKHQNNCEFNNIHCPFEKCTLVETLPNLKLHLIQSHEEVLCQTHEFTRTYSSADTTVVMFCYDNIFKCVYFNYETFVDFYVTLIGASEKAGDYVFEISIQSNKSVLTRKCRCSNWNDSMLAKGVSFDKKELESPKGKKFAFEVNLRIMHLVKRNSALK